jgi:hypothetical protein
LEKHVASIFRAKEYTKHETNLKFLGSFFNPEDGDTCFSKTSVGYHWVTLHYIPDDRTLHNRCENLKSYIIFIILCITVQLSALYLERNNVTV